MKIKISFLIGLQSFVFLPYLYCMNFKAQETHAKSQMTSLVSFLMWGGGGGGGRHVELLVHSEVNATKLGFSGLSPWILKTFYDKIKPLIETKD